MHTSMVNLFSIRMPNSHVYTWCWNNCIPTCKRMNLDLSFTPYTKINSNWNNDLNVRAGTINFISVNLANLEIGGSFLDVTPKA